MNQEILDEAPVENNVILDPNVNAEANNNGQEGTLKNYHYYLGERGCYFSGV